MSAVNFAPRKWSPGELYGKTVTGYTLETVDGKDYNKAVANWKLFYADGTNIYLIADEFILSEYMPPSGDTSVGTGNGKWLAYTSRMANGYPNGSAHITDPKIKALNNDYFNVKNYSSTDYNMRVVAYLLDTNIWNNFKADSAEYAIGAPTLELFIGSYNQKFGKGHTVSAISNRGYQTSICGLHFNEIHNDMGCLSSDDTLYHAGEPSKRSGNLCLASPMNSSNTGNQGSVYVVGSKLGDSKIANTQLRSSTSSMFKRTVPS